MMSTSTQFTIGSATSCADGGCGALRRVVIDPIAEVVTHLVIEPKHPKGADRLVPVDLVVSPSPAVELGCTLAEFHALEDVDETHFRHGATGRCGYGQEELLTWPYHALGPDRSGPVSDDSAGPGAVLSARVPVGDVPVRRGDYVHGSDGAVGRVQGIVVDADSHHVTHILVQEGHVWGEQAIAIPINAVTDFKLGVRLSLTKAEVHLLPDIDLDHSTTPPQPSPQPSVSHER